MEEIYAWNTFRELPKPIWLGNKISKPSWRTCCLSWSSCLAEALWQVLALQSLCISCYPELASLSYWIGDLTSLQSYQMFDCPKLSSLPTSIKTLTKLQNLYISECSELEKRYEKETGQDWPKIAHVQNVYLESLPLGTSRIADI